IPALEEFVVLYVNDDIEITRRTAVLAGFTFACDTQARTGIDSGRYLDLERFLPFDSPLAPAFAADVTNDPSCSMTGRAGSRDREESLLVADLTAAGTRRTANRL